MKHQKIFTEFMKSVVNLNQARIDKATASSNAVINHIRLSDEFKDIYIESRPQGSYGHRTIIKPLPNKEFDVDIVFFLKEQDGWEPRDYINNIKAILEKHHLYKNMIKNGNRCICLDYAGDFHIDVVPCVVKDMSVFAETKQYFVCNKQTNTFELTDPEAYKQWVKDKNTITKNNNLLKSIRLFKYLRDIKTTFSCKSILLTTLLCNRVNDFEQTSSNFTDVATSLRTIITRLDDYLSLHQEMPIISNPVQIDEDFNRHWNQEKYDNFKKFISKYRAWIEDAYDEKDRDISISKWRKVFGDKFNSTTGKSRKSEDYTDILEEASLEHFPIPSYCQQHQWKEADEVHDIELNVSYRPRLSAKNFVHAVSTLTFPKEQALKFEIIDTVPNDCTIYWQITNMGNEAYLNNQLRGNFEIGNRIKEEQTSYKGNHFVEAFIVKESTLIARSGKRIIPIN